MKTDAKPTVDLWNFVGEIVKLGNAFREFQQFSALVTLFQLCFAAYAEAQVEIKLSPMHPELSKSTFEMRIVEAKKPDSTRLFEQSVVRFDGLPVSEIRFTFSCTQGVSICGPFFDGKNLFAPTEILLDENFDQLFLGDFDLCRLKYIFTYPAYYYLYKFDWNINEPNVIYYDDRKLAPDFSGIEQWVVTNSNCGEK